ncbi:hypothetical protein NG2371_03430 [Nocardia gamkensis]|nr:hypothetical protein [Nocardia gamkensis]
MTENNGVRPESRATSHPADGRNVRVLGELVHTATRDLLDYFAKCPRCGYPLQASETTRSFTRGLVERTVFRTCGLPCGWSDSSRELADAVPVHLSRPNPSPLGRNA